MNEANPTTSSPIEPIHGDVVWHGRDMAQRTDWIHHLERTEIGELENAIARIRAQGTEIIDVSKDDFPLPSLGPTLIQIRRDLVDGRGFALIRGIPVDRWSREDVALAFWGIGRYLGEAIMQNRKGHVLGHVTDIGVDPTNPRFRGYQSAADLMPHTDIASDLVALLCLRPAKSGGLSMIASASAIFNEILERRPNLAQVLTQPFYIDRREEIPEGKKPYYQLPVFNPYRGKTTVCYIRRFVESAQRFDDVPALSQAQLEAMDLIDELAKSDAIRLDMDFQPGDIQIVNNLTTLHSRTGYEDWPDPEQRRHLLRLWFAVSDGWPLPSAYFERYDADEHGRPRGVTVPGVRPVASLEPV
tara:strand:- start:1747 stop:2820 length:1074 start_codon:yes stop_codon:yes gene_type:complete